MKISSDGLFVDIYDSVRSIADAETIVNTLEKVKKLGGDEIEIRIHDSMTLPSNVIGYLLKLANDGIKVKLFIKNKTLLELVEFLCMSDKIAIKSF